MSNGQEKREIWTNHLIPIKEEDSWSAVIPNATAFAQGKDPRWCSDYLKPLENTVVFEIHEY